MEGRRTSINQLLDDKITTLDKKTDSATIENIDSLKTLLLFTSEDKNQTLLEDIEKSIIESNDSNLSNKISDAARKVFLANVNHKISELKLESNTKIIQLQTQLKMIIEEADPGILSSVWGLIVPLTEKNFQKELTSILKNYFDLQLQIETEQNVNYNWEEEPEHSADWDDTRLKEPKFFSDSPFIEQPETNEPEKPSTIQASAPEPQQLSPIAIESNRSQPSNTQSSPEALAPILNDETKKANLIKVPMDLKFLTLQYKFSDPIGGNSLKPREYSSDSLNKFLEHLKDLEKIAADEKEKDFNEAKKYQQDFVRGQISYNGKKILISSIVAFLLGNESKLLYDKDLTIEEMKERSEIREKEIKFIASTGLTKNKALSILLLKYTDQNNNFSQSGIFAGTGSLQTILGNINLLYTDLRTNFEIIQSDPTAPLYFSVSKDTFLENTKSTDKYKKPIKVRDTIIVTESSTNAVKCNYDDKTSYSYLPLKAWNELLKQAKKVLESYKTLNTSELQTLVTEIYNYQFNKESEARGRELQRISIYNFIKKELPNSTSVVSMIPFLMDEKFRNEFMAWHLSIPEELDAKKEISETINKIIQDAYPTIYNQYSQVFNESKNKTIQFYSGKFKFLINTLDKKEKTLKDLGESLTLQSTLKKYTTKKTRDRFILKYNTFLELFNLSQILPQENDDRAQYLQEIKTLLTLIAKEALSDLNQVTEVQIKEFVQLLKGIQQDITHNNYAAINELEIWIQKNRSIFPDKGDMLLHSFNALLPAKARLEMRVIKDAIEKLDVAKKNKSDILKEVKDLNAALEKLSNQLPKIEDPEFNKEFFQLISTSTEQLANKAGQISLSLDSKSETKTFDKDYKEQKAKDHEEQNQKEEELKRKVSKIQIKKLEEELNVETLKLFSTLDSKLSTLGQSFLTLGYENAKKDSDLLKAKLKTEIKARADDEKGSEELIPIIRNIQQLISSADNIDISFQINKARSILEAHTYLKPEEDKKEEFIPRKIATTEGGVIQFATKEAFNDLKSRYLLKDISRVFNNADMNEYYFEKIDNIANNIKPMTQERSIEIIGSISTGNSSFSENGLKAFFPPETKDFINEFLPWARKEAMKLIKPSEDEKKSNPHFSQQMLTLSQDKDKNYLLELQKTMPTQRILGELSFSIPLISAYRLTTWARDKDGPPGAEVTDTTPSYVTAYTTLFKIVTYQQNLLVSLGDSLADLRDALQSKPSGFTPIQMLAVESIADEGDTIYRESAEGEFRNPVIHTQLARMGQYALIEDSTFSMKLFEDQSRLLDAKKALSEEQEANLVKAGTVLQNLMDFKKISYPLSEKIYLAAKNIFEDIYQTGIDPKVNPKLIQQNFLLQRLLSIAKNTLGKVQGLSEYNTFKELLAQNNDLLQSKTPWSSLIQQIDDQFENVSIRKNPEFKAHYTRSYESLSKIIDDLKADKPEKQKFIDLARSLLDKRKLEDLQIEHRANLPLINMAIAIHKIDPELKIYSVLTEALKHIQLDLKNLTSNNYEGKIQKLNIIEKQFSSLTAKVQEYAFNSPTRNNKKWFKKLNPFTAMLAAPKELDEYIESLQKANSEMSTLLESVIVQDEEAKKLVLESKNVTLKKIAESVFEDTPITLEEILQKNPDADLVKAGVLLQNLMDVKKIDHPTSQNIYLISKNIFENIYKNGLDPEDTTITQQNTLLTSLLSITKNNFTTAPGLIEHKNYKELLAKNDDIISKNPSLWVPLIREIDTQFKHLTIMSKPEFTAHYKSSYEKLAKTYQDSKAEEKPEKIAFMELASSLLAGRGLEDPQTDHRANLHLIKIAIAINKISPELPISTVFIEATKKIQSLLDLKNFTPINDDTLQNLDMIEKQFATITGKIQEYTLSSPSEGTNRKWLEKLDPIKSMLSSPKKLSEYVVSLEKANEAMTKLLKTSIPEDDQAIKLASQSQSTALNRMASSLSIAKPQTPEDSPFLQRIDFSIKQLGKDTSQKTQEITELLSDISKALDDDRYSLIAELLTQRQQQLISMRDAENVATPTSIRSQPEDGTEIKLGPELQTLQLKNLEKITEKIQGLGDLKQPEFDKEIKQILIEIDDLILEDHREYLHHRIELLQAERIKLADDQAKAEKARADADKVEKIKQAEADKGQSQDPGIKSEISSFEQKAKDFKPASSLKESDFRNFSHYLKGAIIGMGVSAGFGFAIGVGVGTFLGAALTLPFGGIGAPIGTAAGAIIGATIGAVVGFFAGLIDARWFTKPTGYYNALQEAKASETKPESRNELGPKSPGSTYAVYKMPEPAKNLSDTPKLETPSPAQTGTLTKVQTGTSPTEETQAQPGAPIPRRNSRSSSS